MGISRDSAFSRFDLRRAWPRLVLPLVVGLAVGMAVGDVGFRRRLVVGWDAAAAVWLAISWVIIVRTNADETRRRSEAEDPGRAAVGLITLLASSVSFFAGVSLLAEPGADADGVLWIALCLGAVLSAWLVTHTTWTFRYAHLYYAAPSAQATPLMFPGEQPPRDTDFAYFAFTLGMTFQVSDVKITSSDLRRTALYHALLSFLYNTGILAVAINLALGSSD